MKIYILESATVGGDVVVIRASDPDEAVQLIVAEYPFGISKVERLKECLTELSADGPPGVICSFLA